MYKIFLSRYINIRGGLREGAFPLENWGDIPPPGKFEAEQRFFTFISKNDFLKFLQRKFINIKNKFSLSYYYLSENKFQLLNPLGLGLSHKNYPNYKIQFD